MPREQLAANELVSASAAVVREGAGHERARGKKCGISFGVYRAVCLVVVDHDPDISLSDSYKRGLYISLSDSYKLELRIRALPAGTTTIFLKYTHWQSVKRRG